MTSRTAAASSAMGRMATLMGSASMGSHGDNGRGEGGAEVNARDTPATVKQEVGELLTLWS